MANKKINQLVAKTTIQSTDLFPLGDATTGQLFKKTIADLQAAIGGAVISVNGLTGALVLDTDDIQELASPTNRYFTEARARAAISLTTTGSSGASTYSSSTGVLNVPTYTLAGLGGISASFLSGGTGITYNSGTGVISYSGTVYTDASIRALFSAGTGLSYNSSTGAFTNTAPDQTVAIAGGTGISVTGSYPSFTVAFTGTIYTDSSIRGLFSGTAPITFNASTGAIGITQATTSTNGYLSSTDWNTFNGKQSALTIGNLTEATSSVLTITGGTGAVIGSGTSIQVKQASSTVSGFLSSTDWSTFNSKQGTITLTTTGTSGAATFSGGTLNIPQYQGVLTNPVTGTGTSGYVAYFNGSGTIAGSANHFWDATNNRLGIGTASPNRTLEVSTGSDTYSRISGNRGNADAVPVGVLEFYNSNTSILVGEVRGMTGTGGTQSNSGQLAFYTNNAGTYAERIRITSAGDVGINTATPSAKLHVVGTTRINNPSVSGQYMELYTSGGISYYHSQNNSAFYTAFQHIFNTDGTSATERMRITSSGEILVGTTSTAAGYQFHLVRSGSSAFIGISNQGAGSGDRQLRIGFGGTSSYASIQGTRNGVADDVNLAINPDGAANVLIGTTTNNGEKLYVNGSIRATGSITANSDVRLKKNIERIENALEKVEQISGYTYNTIYDEDRHAGVIAQEIDKVLPEIVNKGNDGLMGVEYGNISALLIEAIKDLKTQNDSLQARLSALEK